MAVLKEAGISDYSLPEQKGEIMETEKELKKGKKRTFAEAQPIHSDDEPMNKK